jgi:hypothetical protein
VLPGELRDGAEDGQIRAGIRFFDLFAGFYVFCLHGESPRKIDPLVSEGYRSSYTPLRIKQSTDNDTINLF